MRKIISSTVASVFFLGIMIIASNPAEAGWKEKCAAKIKDIETRSSFLKPQAAMTSALQGMIHDAKEGLKTGKKKACFSNMNTADKRLKKVNR